MNLFLQNTENLHLVGTHYDKSDKATEFDYKEISPKRYENVTNGLTEFVQAFASIVAIDNLPAIQGDRVKLEDGTFYVIANIQDDPVDLQDQHRAQFLKIDNQKIFNLQRYK
jgi:hypothetical protein